MRFLRLLGGGALLLGAGILGDSFPVNAQQQQLPTGGVSVTLPGTVSVPFRISMTTDQAHLMVQVLGAVACPTVAQMVMCQKAKELLESIQSQAREQSGNQ